MLVYSKHVNDDGLFTLLSNIRYKLFNKFPYLRARSGKFKKSAFVRRYTAWCQSPK